MRALSSTISVTTHLAVGAVVLLGTVRRPAPSPRSEPLPVWVFPSGQNAPNGHGGDEGIPVPVLGSFDVSRIASPAIPLPTVGTTAAASTPRGGSWEPLAGTPFLFTDDVPQALAGPLPRYPDVLRQARIEGRVVLEAVVDTTGRVDRSSLTTVFATNPAFVEAAVAALQATLFRPARVNGRAVRVKIRVPYEFTLRDATGSAR